MAQTQKDVFSIKNAEKQWKSIYALGGVATIIVLIGALTDVIIGSITGGDLSALPHSTITEAS